jgi:hypothetical protein
LHVRSILEIARLCALRLPTSAEEKDERKNYISFVSCDMDCEFKQIIFSVLRKMIQTSTLLLKSFSGCTKTKSISKLFAAD